MKKLKTAQSEEGRRDQSLFRVSGVKPLTHPSGVKRLNWKTV